MHFMAIFSSISKDTDLFVQKINKSDKILGNDWNSHKACYVQILCHFNISMHFMAIISLVFGKLTVLKDMGLFSSKNYSFF